MDLFGLDIRHFLQYEVPTRCDDQAAQLRLPGCSAQLLAPSTARLAEG